ncbi:MAG: glycosyltransferase [Chloroflexi bacterium]|nr:glycosyltransferase [Chloroflexota bacterium]
MTDHLFSFGVFWGIWLLVPMLIDGTTALVYLIGAGVSRLQRSRRRPERDAEPRQVSIVIPVYNGADTLPACLAAIRRQRYPASLIEVIVVDNGSTDQTAEVFRQERRKPFGGALQWLATTARGKPWALNAGFYTAQGQYLANIDVDVVLHPDAIRNAVAALEQDSRVGALTAAIEVLPLERRRLRTEVLPPEGDRSPLRRLLSECEFLEYYSAFRIGRQYQSVTNSVFTLAGAFSMFRREVLLQTHLYSKQTVSEDTHVTFQIHEALPSYRVVCDPEVIAYVAPTASLGALYAQRVRWQRGQLEVTALYPRLFWRNPLRLTGLSPARSIIVDHTLAFPRVVWTCLLPLLTIFGYSLPLVVGASLAMYGSYVVVEGISALVSYLLATPDGRQRIRRYWWVFAVMPAYRFLLFWFRFGGFVSVLVEPGVWNATAPWAELRRALADHPGRTGTADELSAR